MCSNSTQPKLYSPYYGCNVREMSLSNQASNPTAALREPAPFQQAPESTQYSNKRKTNSDSLLLLANCATLATTNRAQRCPSPGITEVSSSNRLVNLILHFATSNHYCAFASYRFLPLLIMCYTILIQAADNLKRNVSSTANKQQMNFTRSVDEYQECSPPQLVKWKARNCA